MICEKRIPYWFIRSWTSSHNRNRGDSADRIDVRLREILESIHIIEQCLDKIPSGPIRTEAKIPKRSRQARPITGSRTRGEMGMYVISDGGDKPYR